MVKAQLFRFKQFAVAQGGAAMKVGTDGVLLGAWAGLKHRPARVLDIGTGTGLIALMAAQRGAGWGCRVDAVEVDAAAAAQARENFDASPWASSLTVYNADIKEFEGGFYDLVLSNPPFFADALQAPEVRRNLARHGVALSYEELVRCAERLMSSGAERHAVGTGAHFAVIVPFERADELIRLAEAAGLHIYIRCDVHPLAGKPPRRSMLDFVRGAAGEPACVEGEPVGAAACTTQTLTIEHSPGHYTEEYMALTKDFYLKF